MNSLNNVKALSLLVFWVQTTAAQRPYISPGLQIGVSSDSKFFYSGQVTIGFAPNNPIFAEVLAPGLTLGIRKYKEQVITFTDIQLSIISDLIPFGVPIGAGLGYAWAKSSNGSSSEATFVRGFRGKLWGGILINATFDFSKFSNGKMTGNFGIIGVYPMPVVWGVYFQ